MSRSTSVDQSWLWRESESGLEITRKCETLCLL